MTDDQPGAHHEPSQDSSNRPLDGRSRDTSDSGPRPVGKFPEGLGADGSSPAQVDGLLQHDDALTAEILSENPEAAARMLRIQRSGPIPPAEELIRYEQVLPGVAERIVRMAEGSIDAANQATLSEAGVNNAIAFSIKEDAKSYRRAQKIFAALAIVLIAGTIATSILGVNGTIPLALLAGLSGLGVLLAPRTPQRWRTNDETSTPEN